MARKNQARKMLRMMRRGCTKEPRVPSREWTKLSMQWTKTPRVSHFYVCQTSSSSNPSAQTDAALTEPEVWVKVEEEDGWLTWLACYDTDGPVKEEDVEDNVGRITGAEVQFEQEEIPDVGGSQVPYEQEGTPVDGELSHADAAPEEPDAQLQADKRTGLISDPPSSLVQEEVLEDYESIAQSQEPPIHHLMSPAKARSPTLDYLPLRPSSVPEIARKSTGARKVVVPAQLDDSVMDECDFNMAPLPPAPRAPIPRAPTIRMESCSADNLACLLHLPQAPNPRRHLLPTLLRFSSPP
ncbi:hypothetical protein C8Q80DRAFT_885695 [Daedaleopsis nitida]|nr:hypothetical protein C8Q80DRAFT_885695 [Daedaleopsis nitida]